MCRIDHPRKRLERPRVRGDDRHPVDDPDDLLPDDHLDVVAHQPMRHAVAHGVDIDEGIIGHSPAKALLTPG